MSDLVLACREQVLAPGPEWHPEAPVVELTFLDPVETPTLGALLFEELIAVAEDGGTEDPVEVTLWEPGELSGPVVVEVTSALVSGSSEPIPVEEVLNYGLVLWYDLAEIIFSAAARAARVDGPPVDTIL